MKSPVVRTSLRLGVARVDQAFRAVATEPIAAGETIGIFDGVVVQKPSRYTIQIGPNEHLDDVGEPTLEERMDRYPWRFMNHSCRPNASITGKKIVALTAITPMEEVTFNYNTTEWNMAEPFPCRCGAKECGGRLVRGFKHLSRTERERLRPMLAPHLLERFEDGATA